MTKQKELWNKLALEDAKYYICARKGTGDDVFRQSGLDHYNEHVLHDEFLLSHFGALNDLVVVEVGCGIGRMSEFFSRDFSNVISLDVSGEMIKMAQERLKDINNIRFVETDGESLPCDDDSVDLVFSFLVFQHMPLLSSIEKNFNEINRVLKPEGLCKLQVRGVRSEQGEWYSGVDFNLESMNELCEKTYMKVVKYDGIGKRSFWVWLQKV